MDTGQHKPIQQRPYNTPIALRQSVDKEIDSLLQQGFIRHSESPWASMVTVHKPDSSARICIDFKEINKITEPRPFYMLTVSEVPEAVGKAKVVSKIDLSKGYYQIPMKDSDIQKTALVCHRGRYEFTRMPFGVKNAPAVFQGLMTKVLDSCKQYARLYMDNMVIFSHSWDEHITYIREVLQLLKGAGLTVNQAKCHWGGQYIELAQGWEREDVHSLAQS